MFKSPHIWFLFLILAMMGLATCAGKGGQEGDERPAFMDRWYEIEQRIEIDKNGAYHKTSVKMLSAGSGQFYLVQFQSPDILLIRKYDIFGMQFEGRSRETSFCEGSTSFTMAKISDREWELRFEKGAERTCPIPNRNPIQTRFAGDETIVITFDNPSSITIRSRTVTGDWNDRYYAWVEADPSVGPNPQLTKVMTKSKMRALAAEEKPFKFYR